jgi:hypothetical protein
MTLSAEKKDFLKKVTILIDSREQVNEHITAAFSQLGIMFETRKLDYGDYSFTAEGKDFSHSCVIERKAKIDELYGNVTNDRERIEKELDTISRNAVQCTLILENCKDWDYLKEFQISEAGAETQGRKVRNIGATVYSALQAWRCGNRYRFDVEFVMERKNTALKMLELFYYFWHNYKQQTAPRK